MQPSKDCVQKTVKRLEEKVAGRVLKQASSPVLYCSSVAAAACTWCALNSVPTCWAPAAFLPKPAHAAIPLADLWAVPCSA